MNNKFIKLITSDNRFAFIYIAILFFVGYMAVFKNAGYFWEATGWTMSSFLGVIITITAYTSSIQAIESRRWPQRTAKLISTKISHGRSSSDGFVYSPEVEYEYTFEGNKYNGNQIDFSAMSSSEAWAQKIIDKIRKNGETIVIYVNPEDPGISVINPGIRLVHLLRFIVGPAITIFSILFGLGTITL